jgi:hypothetical protein
MIVIAIEGGLVQSVSSDDPDLVGKAVTIIDYDAEGADPDEVERVPQGRGRTADATISSHEVGRLYAPVARFLRAERKAEGDRKRPALRLVTKPLTAEQVRRMAVNGELTVTVLLDLDELGVDRDCLNDAVSERITGGPEALEDISYVPVGVKGDSVIVKVCASVANWLECETEDAPTEGGPA